jgi:murein DD-endopeptidase
MGIKWEAVFLNEKRQFENMTEAERFIYFLLLQFGSPYGWGKENPESSDCSGAVCLALFAATGLLIRATADGLYKRVFTDKNPGRDTIRAAFFVADGDRKQGDERVLAGAAVHVAGILDDGSILNSQEGGARVRRLADISHWFWKDGYGTAIRGLDRGSLVRLAGEGKTRYGLDPELTRYLELAL